MKTEIRQSVDLVFLALVTWREARGESLACRAAVACSIMNRVKRPAWWGNSIMSVVTKKWQYSSMTDPKDRQLVTWPAENDSSWVECLELCDDILSGKVSHPAPGADSYYDISIPAPYWAKEKNFVGQIGKIRFFNLDMDVEK